MIINRLVLTGDQMANLHLAEKNAKEVRANEDFNYSFVCNIIQLLVVLYHVENCS